jgi:hypothetical protein
MDLLDGKGSSPEEREVYRANTALEPVEPAPPILPPPTNLQQVVNVLYGYEASVNKAIEANLNQEMGPPSEPYNRELHYGKTPTTADRRAVGGESVDHQPPLVQRYYEGDPAKGEKPGHQMTPEERKASAADRERMSPSTNKDQRSQGGKMSKYSKDKKKENGSSQ